MSSVATTTTTTTTTIMVDEHCCPNCGLSLPTLSPDPHAALLQAQRQIEDLQEQVRQLNIKAKTAVHEWADYEDELSQQRATSSTTITTTNKSPNISTNQPVTPDSSISNGSARSSFLGSSRISQLLSPRRTASTSPLPRTTITPATAAAQEQGRKLSKAFSPESPNSSTAQTRELIAALEHERFLRMTTEEKLAATTREIEDLSAALFEEANTMVATERKARAALEERVGVLEQRDLEKGQRVGRLEGAVRQIERVQGLLGWKGAEGGDKGAEVETGGNVDGDGKGGEGFRDENEALGQGC
ncbi:hypothetical protein GGS21DRAFT_485654 [Xylaria nigripes]|nr:hypothetical protein GGS21DRAFT_485654 [Xylaria nigripes]